MSVTQEFRFDPGQILQPAQPSYLTRLEPAAWGNSLTIVKGQAVGQKTSDGKMYPLNLAATDGTQLFKGFSQYPVVTDSSGNVQYLFGGSATGINYYAPTTLQSPIYTGGIFDPNDLITAATGTLTAEVDTVTPTNPTTGDLYSVTTPNGDGVTVTVGATQTATATVTLLANAWNANPVLKALATTSGTTTFILTAVTPGQALNLKATAVGTGTVALVVTTPAVDAAQGEVDTFTATNPTTGDVYTLTATFGNGSTRAVSATVGATQTATAIDALLTTAWNNDPVLSQLATASGTTTLILTAPSGGALSVAAGVVGTGTMAKVVTTKSAGRNINDILPGCPGARVLGNGYWEIP